MLPWLFNLFMDGVVRQLNASITNAGVCLNQRDGRQRSVSSLLFSDDEVLIAEGEECLQKMLNEMEVVC